MNTPGNHGLVYMQSDHHVDYDRRNNSGNPEHEPMPNVDYDRRYYSGNTENVPIPNHLLIMQEGMIIIVIFN